MAAVGVACCEQQAICAGCSEVIGQLACGQVDVPSVGDGAAFEADDRAIAVVRDTEVSQVVTQQAACAGVCNAIQGRIAAGLVDSDEDEHLTAGRGCQQDGADDALSSPRT